MKELIHIKGPTVVERDTPADPKALKEIRGILEGIESQRLLHYQNSYHAQTECGTAHCIAGWKAHNDAIKAGLDFTYTKSCFDEVSSAELDEFMKDKSGTSSEWVYAEEQWGLEPIEAAHLFDTHLTLDEQFELLEVLEAGYTLKYDE